jgi:hypothetical protein
MVANICLRLRVRRAMKIESARELKAKLLKVELPVVMAAMAAETLRSVAARPRAGQGKRHRSMSIGLAPLGKRQVRLAIRVQRQALMGSPAVEAAVRAARGEADVRFVGRVEKRTAGWMRARQRPLRIGCSIGHHAITAGTLGCFVRKTPGGGVHILSNNHVLADENAAARGDAIIQPGDADKGRRPGDVVASLRSFVRLKTGANNLVDAAIAEVKAGVDFDARSLGSFGTLNGVGADILDDGIPVRKIGRTTGETTGRVSAFELDEVVVGFGIGNLAFDNQIEIESDGAGPFSDGGDSGSAILDAENRIVALLFAGSETGGSNGLGVTYANPIRAVFDALKIGLLT